MLFNITGLVWVVILFDVVKCYLFVCFAVLWFVSGMIAAIFLFGLWFI